MADVLNYVMEQGSTFTRVTFGKTNPAGALFDLSDYSIRGQIKQSFTGSLVENFNISLSGSAAQGGIVIQLTAAQSAAIPAGDYFYDVEIVSGSVVKRWQEGQLRVTPEVTT